MSKEAELVLEKAQLDEALLKVTEKIEAGFEKAEGEAKEAKTVSTETKAELEKLAEKANAIGERLTTLEQRDFGAEAGEVKSLGEQFVESDGFKAFAEGRQGRARMEVKTAVINATGQNQPLVPSDRDGMSIYTTPNRALRIRDLLTVIPTTSNLIEFTRESSFTNNAGPQIGGSPEAYENVTKPESAVAFSLVNTPVVTLAHFIPASKQVLDDAPQLQGFINGRLMYGLKLKEETQILSGTGSNHQYNGLITQATAYASGDSPEPSGEIDRLRDAIRQAHIAEYRPNFCVLNPQDWYDIEIKKVGTSDDRYVVGNPNAGLLREVLWGLPIVVTNSVSAGTFLLGDTNAAALYDRQQAVVEASYENSDNFEKNMVTIRAEQRGCLAVHRTEAFITGSL